MFTQGTTNVIKVLFKTISILNNNILFNEHFIHSPIKLSLLFSVSEDD